QNVHHPQKRPYPSSVFARGPRTISPITFNNPYSMDWKEGLWMETRSSDQNYAIKKQHQSINALNDKKPEDNQLENENSNWQASVLDKECLKKANTTEVATQTKDTLCATCINDGNSVWHEVILGNGYSNSSLEQQSLPAKEDLCSSCRTYACKDGRKTGDSLAKCDKFVKTIFL
ncbi:hypothetical protein Bhyg_08800, partial [Pseudolycoriella hygida]